jgi:RING finger/CHY zinc finger protein 1
MCNHYVNNCSILADCCNKIFSCKKCHNENSDHEVKRQDINKIICNVCFIEQKITNLTSCISCCNQLSEYQCDICKLYDKNFPAKYHCNKCDMCLVGDKHNVYHCNECNYCLPIQFINNHRHTENYKNEKCSICLESLIIDKIFVTQCFHSLHRKCIEKLYKTSNLCPLCKSVFYLSK